MCEKWFDLPENDSNVWKLLMYVGEKGRKKTCLSYLRMTDLNVWKLPIYVGKAGSRETGLSYVRKNDSNGSCLCM